MAALLVWGSVYYLHESQEFEISLDQLNLDIRQRAWLDVVKDCDCVILYYPWKENVVSNSLSRKADSSAVENIYIRISIKSPFLV